MMRMSLRLVIGFIFSKATTNAVETTLASAADVAWLQAQLGAEGLKIGERLFRLSEDWDADTGYPERAFHERCDSQGPTVVIVENTSGVMWGGYSDASWESVSSQAVPSDDTFLFTLESEKFGREKLALTGMFNSQAVILNEDFGPCWIQACIIWGNNGSVRLGEGYAKANFGSTKYLERNRFINVKDYEVFKVVPDVVESKLASAEDLVWLGEQLGDLKIGQLLFRLSEDWDADTGYPERAFHERCDGQGPTVVIIKNTSGVMWGGYSDASWESVSSQTVPSDDTFLFTLESHKFGREKLALTGMFNSQAVILNEDFGPCWIQACIIWGNNGSVRLGEGYAKANGGHAKYLERNRHLKVEDYEVYSVHE